MIQNAKLCWLKRARKRLRCQSGGLAQPDREQATRFMESQDPELDCRCSDLVRNLQVFLLEGMYSHGIQ